MTNITLELTEAQTKALEYIAIDAQVWIENAAEARAINAINDIVRIYTERALDEGITIPSTRDSIVLDAYARGWIESAATVNARVVEMADAEMAAAQAVTSETE